MHDDAKLGRFFEEDAKLVLRKQELIEKRDRLSKANAAMANIQVRGGGDDDDDNDNDDSSVGLLVYW